MLILDGSLGEGGGQVLRTALGLSVVTGTPFLIEKIRAGRDKPGLKRQHLTAVLAAAEVSQAEVTGAAIGSGSLAFRPTTLRAGDYRFAIGSAGSTTLVLQTVLPALLSAGGDSTVQLSGGTHNPMAPPFDFLQHTFAPLLSHMGARLELDLVRHGFFPAGGGQWDAAIQKAAWLPLELLTRSDQPLLQVRILLSRIRRQVGEREAAVLRARLALTGDQIEIQEVDSAGPGNVVMVRVGLGPVTEVVTAIGERGVPAEDVAGKAADEVEALLAANVPVGPHLADQLLIPMALAGGGSFRTLTPSLHTRTNAMMIERFLPVRFEMREDPAAADTCIVRVLSV